MSGAHLLETMTARPAIDVTPLDDALAATLRNSVELRPGTILGDFQIESLLGRGGMSHVYRARQQSLDRIVALKVTRVREGDSHGIDEGRTMAAVVHEHIVPVYSEQTIGPLRLLAVGFVAGPTLAELLAEQRQGRGPDAHVRTFGRGCPKDETRTAFACRTISDLARALAHAHGLGVLHCDIKPANILFTPESRALLTDFNVSVRRHGHNISASVEPVGGTLSYMAPEQLALLTGSSRAGPVDERADLYSLGLVLFELLTSDWPFDESQVGNDPLAAPVQLQAIRLSSTVRFPASGPRLSAGLRSIVEKCLAPLPDDRYQTADDLAEDLDRHRTHRPLRFAPDPSVVERTLKRLQRHPFASLTAAFCLLLTIMAARGPATLPLNRSAHQVASAAEARRASDFDRRGRELLAQRRFEDALSHFGQAVALNPQLAPAFHNQGVARFRLGQFAGACASFDEAIKLGNSTGLLLSHRAAARFALGDVAGAEADFRRAQAIATPAELEEVLANLREYESRRAAPP